MRMLDDEVPEKIARVCEADREFVKEHFVLMCAGLDPSCRDESKMQRAAQALSLMRSPVVSIATRRSFMLSNRSDMKRSSENSWK